MNDLLERLESSLTNQTPSPRQIEAIEKVREFAKLYGAIVINAQPPSRELSLALTKLEESVMWAVKGIILNGKATCEAPRCAERCDSPCTKTDG